MFHVRADSGSVEIWWVFLGHARSPRRQYVRVWCPRVFVMQFCGSTNDDASFTLLDDPRDGTIEQAGDEHCEETRKANVEGTGFFCRKCCTDGLLVVAGRWVVIVPYALSRVSSRTLEVSAQRGTFWQCAKAVGKIGYGISHGARFPVSWFVDRAQGVPVTVLICVFAAEPSDQIPLATVEQEESFAHVASACRLQADEGAW
jgi:hypothetical protein